MEHFLEFAQTEIKFIAEIFKPYGINVRSLDITDYSSDLPGKCKHHKKISYYLDINKALFPLEINVAIWNDLSYCDVYREQVVQIEEKFGLKAVQSLNDHIKILKALFKSWKLYRESSNQGVWGVGIEQLVIQSGRDGNDPLTIIELGDSYKALNWIIKASNCKNTDISLDYIEKFKSELNVLRVRGLVSKETGSYFDKLTITEFNQLIKMANITLKNSIIAYKW
jgi:hypothetical protein